MVSSEFKTVKIGSRKRQCHHFSMDLNGCITADSLITLALWEQTEQVNLQNGSLEMTDGLTATYTINRSDIYTESLLHLIQVVITIPWV